jgi:ATP-dependent RNA helicase DDX19/DBP5
MSTTDTTTPSSSEPPSEADSLSASAVVPNEPTNGKDAGSAAAAAAVVEGGGGDILPAVAHNTNDHKHVRGRRPPPSAVVSALSVTARSDQKESDELTKRLQKLALERQKEAAGDRLKVIQSDTSSHLSSAKTFQELNLPEFLLDSIFSMGFDRPSAIQEEALPRILANPPRNVIGQAQSGSGKTAAFTLGMLYRINVDSPATTQALCVTPTRELAVQIVDKAVRPMAANMAGLKIELAIAGATASGSSGPDSRYSSHHRGTVDAHLVVGTPGKVVDWLKRRYINPKTIKVFVLDEADNMVDEDGHRANSALIKKALPKTCQCLLFSATYPEEVIQFASKLVESPDKILIEDGPEFLVRTRFSSHSLAVEPRRCLFLC